MIRRPERGLQAPQRRAFAALLFVIIYTITEDPVPGYTSEVTGYDVTNTYTPGRTQVNVSKAWEDGGNKDSIRPASVSVKLLADGSDTGKTLVLSGKNGWTGSFTELDETKNGRKIAYTVEEVKTDVITGKDGEGTYGIAVEGSASKGFTITNTHTPGDKSRLIDVDVRKIWKDGDDTDGIRPASVTARLFADGTDTGRTVVLSAENGWKATFTGLAEKSGKAAIRYTVEEELTGVITGTDGEGTYAVSVEGSAAKGFTITNTHTPKGKLIDVDVRKVWDDIDDNDQIRPDSVTARLFADGQDTGRTLVLSEENDWKAAFTGLAEKADGAAIEYTVEEELTDVITGIDGEGTYAVSIEGNADTGFIITNSHRPVWNPRYYTVTYDVNGGYWKDTGTSEYRYDTNYVTVGVKIREAPVRPGYIFIEWRGSSYQPGEDYHEKDADGFFVDDTLVAQWKRNSVPPDRSRRDDPPPVVPVPDVPSVPEEPPVEVPDEGVPDEGIPDDGIPETGRRKSPKTGDDRHTKLWGSLSVTSLLLLFAYFEERKRRKR